MCDFNSETETTQYLILCYRFPMMKKFPYYIKPPMTYNNLIKSFNKHTFILVLFVNTLWKILDLKITFFIVLIISWFVFFMYSDILIVFSNLLIYMYEKYTLSFIGLSFFFVFDYELFINKLNIWEMKANKRDMYHKSVCIISLSVDM